MTESVVGAIAPKLERAEIERTKRKPTVSLDAYDYYLRGIAKYYQWTSREANSEALALFQRAAELDPEFALAYGWAARCYLSRQANVWMTNRNQDIAEATKLARRATELSNDDATILSLAGFTTAYVIGDLDRGRALIDRALMLNPNLAMAWHFSGWVRAYLGQPKLAIEQLARAMRLSPLDPVIGRAQCATATAYFVWGRYDEAASWAERSLQSIPEYLTALSIAAASNALASRLIEARAAAAELKLINSTLRISDLKYVIPFRRPEDIAKYEDGLRKAGLQE